MWFQRRNDYHTTHATWEVKCATLPWASIPEGRGVHVPSIFVKNYHLIDATAHIDDCGIIRRCTYYHAVLS